MKMASRFVSKLGSMGLAVALAFSSTLSLAATTAEPLPARPPQYVLLAFDGSLNLDFWNESYTFAHQNDIKFTYFISGVYFLLNSKKAAYTEPTHGIGKSAIGWGGTSPANIQARVNWVNRAYDDGNEIGSHANGHFDGTKWTLAEWSSEFKQFYHLIFDVFRINEISNIDNPYHFTKDDMKGFRAPLLGQNPAMYQVLHDYNYVYDTSKTAPMTYWPEKVNGIWNFPLASVRIAGTGKRTLSMDYNFYFAQSAGLPQPAKYAEFKKEMLDTYMGYFMGNYNGNRAPVHIGHHFSKWNGGAYWDAMKEFVHNVCGLPEVKCVTYGELTKFMESLTPAQLAAFRKGQFNRGGMPIHVAANDTAKTMAIDASVIVNGPQMSLLAHMSGPDAETVKAQNPTYTWSVDGQPVAQTTDATIDSTDLDVKPGSKVKVAIDLKGKEILTATQTVTGFTDSDELTPTLSAATDESRALIADPPEAHEQEE